jgi:hypothetical protein
MSFDVSAPGSSPPPPPRKDAASVPVPVDADPPVSAGSFQNSPLPPSHVIMEMSETMEMSEPRRLDDEGVARVSVHVFQEERIEIEQSKARGAHVDVHREGLLSKLQISAVKAAKVNFDRNQRWVDVVKAELQHLPQDPDLQVILKTAEAGLEEAKHLLEQAKGTLVGNEDYTHQALIEAKQQLADDKAALLDAEKHENRGALSVEKGIIALDWKETIAEDQKAMSRATAAHQRAVHAEAANMPGQSAKPHRALKPNVIPQASSTDPQSALPDVPQKGAPIGAESALPDTPQKGAAIGAQSALPDTPQKGAAIGAQSALPDTPQKGAAIGAQSALQDTAPKGPPTGLQSAVTR